MTDQTWLDRMINRYAPRIACQRMAARMQMDAMAQFMPLRQDRGSQVIGTTQGSLDERLPWWDRLKMIAMFDTLVHENPLLSGMVDQYICNVVPAAGVRPQPMSGNDDYDKAARDVFDEWAENGECRGMSFWEFQRPFLKSVLGHGDAGVARIAESGRLSVQGISANRIATPATHAVYENAEVHQGIYTGGGTRVQGFYVVRRDQWGLEMAGQHRFVPADYMLQAFAPEKFDFDNYRGVSNFLTCFPQIQRINSLLQYKTFQEKMASVFGIAIVKSKEKTTSPLTAVGTRRETTGGTATGTTRPDFELFQGMGVTLQNDEDIKTIEHRSAGNDFSQFMNTVAQFIGVGAGLPLEFVLLDWSRSNYYGNKMVTTMAKRKFSNSYMNVTKLVRFAYRWIIQDAIDSGRLKVRSGADRPLAMQCTLPPPLELDEGKAFELKAREVENNVGTWDEYAMSQGRNLDDIIKKRREEIDKMKKQNLPVLVSSKPGIKTLQELEQQQSGE